MSGPVSKRSMYDLKELRTIVQKMHRNPGLLTGGWIEFFYFLDEYFPTMKKDPSRLLSFLVEDCARCPLDVLKAVTDIFQTTRKEVKIEDYRKVSAAIARQPVDRSAAYLSVACLDSVSSLSDKMRRSLFRGRLERWESRLRPEEKETTRRSFAVCVALLDREVRAVPHQYPMTPKTALRLAAALSHLVAWDLLHPKVRLDKRGVGTSLAGLLLQNIHPPVRLVRPLIYGLIVACDWMWFAGETVDPRAKLFVNQYIQMGLACSANKSARLDLLAMNAILVLMGRFPNNSAPGFMSDNLPRDPKAVPRDPRAFPMPKVSHDRHTDRRKNLTDRKKKSKKLRRGRGLEVSKSKGYSHGVSRGFEEFMEHIRTCEDQTSDGTEPVFKEAALRVYHALSKKSREKPMEILNRNLQISDDRPRKGLASKRKREGAAGHVAKKRKMSRVQKDS